MATAPQTQHHAGDDRAAAEVLARVSQIERDFRLLSIGELCRRVEGIRGLARVQGFTPVVRITGGLTDALAKDGRAAMVRPYLDAIRAAVAGDLRDPRAGDAFLASISVRLA